MQVAWHSMSLHDLISPYICTSPPPPRLCEVVQFCHRPYTCSPLSTQYPFSNSVQNKTQSPGLVANASYWSEDVLILFCTIFNGKLGIRESVSTSWLALYVTSLYCCNLRSPPFTKETRRFLTTATHSYSLIRLKIFSYQNRTKSKAQIIL